MANKQTERMMESEEVYIDAAKRKAESDKLFVERLNRAIPAIATAEMYLHDMIVIADAQKAIERSASPYGREWAIERIKSDYRSALDAIDRMKIAVEAIDFKIRLNID